MTRRLRGSAREQIEELARRYAHRLICLTRGAHGSLLYSQGQWADDPSQPVAVKDTVAGTHARRLFNQALGTSTR